MLVPYVEGVPHEHIGEAVIEHTAHTIPFSNSSNQCGGICGELSAVDGVREWHTSSRSGRV